jgi:NAD(P)-dependent dehydrogenase (short-subunit alcohol dehydrogenase family)
MSQFSDRVAIVTGATSGIGRAVATLLASKGARVVIAARREDRGGTLVDELRAKGLNASFIQTDVSSANSVADLVARTVALYGRLDCAVNNAGISGPNALLADYEEAAWDRVTSVNLKGVWLCMKHEIAQLLANGGGTIVNIASDFGVVGSALGIAPYVASKHGVIGLSRAAALEYADKGIRVNAVCPSFTETEMLAPALEREPDNVRRFIASHIPLQRMAAPEEIAEAVVWMCSRESSFVTGHALMVDGGAVAR